DQVHRAVGKSPLVCGLRVTLRHPDSAPTEDGHKLVRGGTGLCGDGRARLAQTVGSAMGQVRLVAPSSKLVAEALVRERMPAVVDKEGQVATGRDIDDTLQGRKDRDAESL